MPHLLRLPRLYALNDPSASSSTHSEPREDDLGEQVSFAELQTQEHYVVRFAASEVSLALSGSASSSQFGTTHDSAEVRARAEVDNALNSGKAIEMHLPEEFLTFSLH